MNIKLLVGVSSTGKSTYINDSLGGVQNNYIISDDDITNEVAKEIGLTYNEMFLLPKDEEMEGSINKKYGKVLKISKDEQKKLKIRQKKVYFKQYQAKKEEYLRFERRIELGLIQEKDIIVDMPNLTEDSRIEILSRIEKKSKIVLKIEHVVFRYGDIEIVKAISEIRRIKTEKRGGTKTIPEDVHDLMHSIFIEPTNNENYVSSIKVVDNEMMLRRVLIKEHHILEKSERNYKNVVLRSRIKSSKLKFKT